MASFVSNCSFTKHFFHKMQQDILQDIYFIIQSYKPTSSKKVNSELSKIIALLLRDFIHSWYSNLSQDKEFYSELMQTVTYLTQEIERRLFRVDWVGLMTFDLPLVLKQHIRDFRACCSKLGTAYAGGKNLEELFYGCQPHIALKDTNSEVEYMRKVSELLVDTLIPEHELQSESARILVRELVCNNVLMMMLDLLSEPVYLNELLLKVCPFFKLDFRSNMFRVANKRIFKGGVPFGCI